MFSGITLKRGVCLGKSESSYLYMNNHLFKSTRSLASVLATASMVAVATGSVLGACGKAESATKRDGQFAIGVGAIPGSPGYDNVVRGIAMAVERLNEVGTLKFTVRLPNKGSVSAIQVAQQLRDDPSVLGVVGHPESGTTIEAIPIYEDAQHEGQDAVVAISPTASSPRLSGISPWFFRVAPSDDEAARYVAQWVIDSLHATRAAIIFRNDSYGRDWASTFTAAYENSGAKVITRDPYLTGITEWDAYAQLLARLKPDVLLFPGDAGDAVQMLEALRAANVDIPFIGGDGTEGMRDSAVAEGARYVAFFRAERVSTEEGKTFVRRYNEKYHQDPDMFAALSYDAAMAIGHTIRTGANTRKAVQQALQRLGGKDSPAVEGAGGMIAFESDHDISGRTVVITQIGARSGAPGNARRGTANGASNGTSSSAPNGTSSNAPNGTSRSASNGTSSSASNGSREDLR